MIGINSNGLTATNSQPAETNKSTNDLDFPTGQRQRKDESTLFARLALAGYEVRSCGYSDYVVSINRISEYCSDMRELREFADLVEKRCG